MLHSSIYEIFLREGSVAPHASSWWLWIVTRGIKSELFRFHISWWCIPAENQCRRQTTSVFLQALRADGKMSKRNPFSINFITEPGMWFEPCFLWSRSITYIDIMTRLNTQQHPFLPSFSTFPPFRWLNKSVWMFEKRKFISSAVIPLFHLETFLSLGELRAARVSEERNKLSKQLFEFIQASRRSRTKKSYDSKAFTWFACSTENKTVEVWFPLFAKTQNQSKLWIS